MVWIWVFLGIAFAGLVMLIFHAIWLSHKAADLFSEIQMLGTRAQELGELVSQVSLTADVE
ncbi:MAG: hypothetical protein FWG47_03960 [Propionibacteriaceae bacterium]|nr:hypothetical protein [Propionibacteriaceae bacterium]